MKFNGKKQKFIHLLLSAIFCAQNALACHEGPCQLENDRDAYQKVLFARHLNLSHDRETLHLKEHHEALKDALYHRVRTSNIPDKSHAVLNQGESYPNKVTASIGVIGRDAEGVLKVIYLPVGRYDVEQERVHPFLFTSHYVSHREQRTILSTHGLVVGNDDVSAPDYMQVSKNFCTLMEGASVPFQKHMKENIELSLQAQARYEKVCRHMNQTGREMLLILEEKASDLMRLYKMKIEAEKEYLLVKENKDLIKLQKTLIEALKTCEEEKRKTTDQNPILALEEQIGTLQASIHTLKVVLKLDEKEGSKKKAQALWAQKKADDNAKEGLYCYLIEKLMPLLDLELGVDHQFQKAMEDWAKALRDVSKRFTVAHYQKSLSGALSSTAKSIEKLNAQLEASKTPQENSATSSATQSKKINVQDITASLQKYTNVKKNLEERLTNLEQAVRAAEGRRGDQTIEAILFEDVKALLFQLNRVSLQVADALPEKSRPKGFKVLGDETRVPPLPHSPSTYLKHNVIFMGHGEQALVHHLMHEMDEKKFGYKERLQALLEQEGIKIISGLMLNVHTQRNLCKCCAATIGRFLEISTDANVTSHPTYTLEHVMRRFILSKLDVNGLQIEDTLSVMGSISFTDSYDPRDPISKDIRNLMTLHTFGDEPLEDGVRAEDAGSKDPFMIQVKLERPVL
ncbi:MAG: hypothetical protein ACTHJ4_01180 [Candidatus Nucleicultricaceae bacterium]